jgi:NAD+ synthase (glutamine-hydrolysing)
MRIALAQLNYIIGDFEKNTGLIRNNIQKAKAAGAELVVFAELCICAYPPGDFLEFNDFISRCKKAAEEIAAECIGITAIVGLPAVNPKPEGKNLFNTAYVLNNGKITGEIHKSLLPTYDIFDEYRYFEPSRSSQCIEVNNVKIALTICEDLWNVDDDPMYVSSPMETLIKEKPQLMINIAASPFDYLHAQQRKDILLRNVDKYHLPLIYVNHVGAQTELIFDGGSLAINKSSETVAELNYFSEDFRIIDFDTSSGDIITDNSSEGAVARNYDPITLMHSAIILGIRDYFHKLNFKKAILGLSGGIDSALVTCLAAEALGPENVHVILMPSQFSSEGSVNDSVALAEKTGVSYDIIRIKEIYDQYLKALEPIFKNLPFGIAEENLQARIRAALLMAESNKFGSILLNTSNKSEMAVGYGTLYGDMCGGISVIGDIYKTDVYRLCEYINRNEEIIPNAIIRKPPSAELRLDQKDTDSLPEYSILDKILFEYIENRKGPGEIINQGFDEALVKKILKMVNTNEYKRYQTPPVLRVSPKAFGTGRRLPIVGKYLA